MNEKVPASYVVDYARSQIGNPYWFSCYGQILNSSIWAVNKRTYPDHYTDERKAIAKERGDYGKKGHDCRGLLLGALWTYPKAFNMPSTYCASQDMDANRIYRKATEKGAISETPCIPGIAVWKNNHIGVVEGRDKDGDITVIEALGFNYGVVRSKLKNRNFTNWCKPHFIDYGTEAGVKPIDNIPTGANKVNIELPVLRNGSKCTEVKTLQILLNEKCRNGAFLVVDGDFGPMTEKQVRNYQSQNVDNNGNALEVDGIVGRNTWTALLTH